MLHPCVRPVPPVSVQRGRPHRGLAPPDDPESVPAGTYSIPMPVIRALVPDGGRPLDTPSVRSIRAIRWTKQGRGRDIPTSDATAAFPLEAHRTSRGLDWRIGSTLPIGGDLCSLRRAAGFGVYFMISTRASNRNAPSRPRRRAARRHRPGLSGPKAGEGHDLRGKRGDLPLRAPPVRSSLPGVFIGIPSTRRSPASSKPVSSGGRRRHFTFTTVPEPSGLVLGGISTLSLAAWPLRRRQAKATAASHGPTHPPASARIGRAGPTPIRVRRAFEPDSGPRTSGFRA